MNTRFLLAAAALAVAPAFAQMLSQPWSDSPALRLTDSCNTVAGASSQAIIDAPEALRLQITAATANRDLDPGLLRTLWIPQKARQTNFLSFENEVIVDYVDRFQDLSQIVGSINGDPDLAARALHISVNGAVCFSAMPPAPMVTVREFYHPQMNHYRLAASAAESAALGSDGWLPTGDSFRALGEGACYDASAVFRFARSFGERRGSRFMTIDAAECGAVRKHNHSWRPEDIPFFAKSPQGGQCSTYDGATSVYRLYNGRAAFNDMNHRYTTSVARYNGMIAQGWIAEGIAFCAAGQ